MEDAERRGVAVLFERVSGSQLPLVYNLLGSRAAVGIAVSVEPREAARRFREALAARIEPVRVDGAPVQEVVATGEDADLRALPLVVHSDKDAAPYVTAGLVLAHDPETGARNVSI